LLSRLCEAELEWLSSFWFGWFCFEGKI